MPWDLGSRGTCMVGGNVSTHAGGLNVIKKGLLRGYILGMEVVLANG
jgi:D-2-hydroxyglutarate dehydrogenase